MVILVVCFYEKLHNRRVLFFQREGLIPVYAANAIDGDFPRVSKRVVSCF